MFCKNRRNVCLRGRVEENGEGRGKDKICSEWEAGMCREEWEHATEVDRVIIC